MLLGSSVGMKVIFSQAPPSLDSTAVMRKWTTIT